MALYITTDATCDLPEKFYKENFNVIPMSYNVNGIDYDGDKTKLAPAEFYQKIREGAMPTTSLISEFNARTFFEPLLKAGHDVIHVAFSSGLSGSYLCLSKAADDLKSEYPDRKIAVVDSLAAAQGEGLLVLYTLKKRDGGANFEEIVEFIEKTRDNVCHLVIADDLKHLHRGGRVSKTQAVLGTALGIKPLIHVNYQGKLIPYSKAKGSKKAVLELVAKMTELMKPADEQDVVLIGHTDAFETATFAAEKIKEKNGVTNIDISYIGPVIGSHTGAGTVAVFFIGNTKI